MLLYFEMELSSPKPEKVLIFFPPKILLYLSMEPPAPSLKNKTKQKKNLKNFLYFSQKNCFFTFQDKC